MSHATIGNVLGASCQHLDKVNSKLLHARDADNSGYTTRTYAGVLSTSDDDQNVMLGTMLSYLKSSEAAGLEQEFANLRAVLEADNAIGGFLDNELAISQADRDAGMFDYVYSEANGAIAIIDRIGRIGALYAQMITDSRTVLQCTVTPGSLTAQSGNIGSLTSTSPTFFDHCLSGTIILECIDESVTAPKIRITQDLGTAKPLPAAPTLAQGDSGQSTKTMIVSDHDLTPDKSYADGPVGISSYTITRGGLTSPTETGDAGNIFSAYTVTNPKTEDCTSGIFYFKVTRQSSAPIWLIEVYADSGYTDLRGTVTTDTVLGTPSLSITCKSGTTIAFTFSRVAANVAMGSAGGTQSHNINILTPRLGDRWTMVVTNDYASKAQTKLARWGRFSLPSSGSAHADYAEAKFTTPAMP